MVPGPLETLGLTLLCILVAFFHGGVALMNHKPPKSHKQTSICLLHSCFRGRDSRQSFLSCGHNSINQLNETGNKHFFVPASLAETLNTYWGCYFSAVFSGASPSLPQDEPVPFGRTKPSATRGCKANLVLPTKSSQKFVLPLLFFFFLWFLKYFLFSLPQWLKARNPNSLMIQNGLY